ncbi:MAG: UvrB/UvrC motif-containing protein [Verrucomicrobia bacterium]|nr:UvrB/UvrC motif-containing protein [Verrucomicrobiota bacterium]
MLCQICKKAEATVHLTQVVGGKIRKLDLCAACAEKCGVDDPAGFSMLEILKKFSHAISSDKEEPQPKKKQTEELVCPECGYTSQDLSKTGKLGCPFCYKTFVENLENALKHMHRGTQHIGKTPKYHPLPESGVKPAADEPPVKKTRKRAAAKTASSKKKAGAPDVYENPELLEELYESKKALLKQTIEEENYEYAAKIRDEIKELEKKIKAKKVKKDENQDLLDALKTLFDGVEGEDK